MIVNIMMHLELSKLRSFLLCCICMQMYEICHSMFPMYESRKFSQRVSSCHEHDEGSINNLGKLRQGLDPPPFPQSMHVPRLMK